MANEDGVFKAILSTKGRKTGKDHSVMLRAVRHNGKIYFSRHRPDGDWFRNAITNPEVIIKYNDSSYAGKARQVTDKAVEEKISQLKYPGQKRAAEKRVVVEVTLYEQS